MITTFEIMGMMLLFIILGFAIWWFLVAQNYRKYLTNYSYTRGANVASKGRSTLLQCDSDKEICVYRAVQICTNPNSSNYENPSTEPMSSGTTGNEKYGQFNKSTTIDMTSDLGGKCDGKEKCAYKFVGKQFPSGMICSGKTQLIATYTCIPKNTKCRSYKG